MRMGGLWGTGGTATQRTGAPHGPLSPFPQRKRWRSPGLFLSSPRRCEDGMGPKSRGNRIGMRGTRGMATTTMQRRGESHNSPPLFSRRRGWRSPGFLLYYLLDKNFIFVIPPENCKMAKNQLPLVSQFHRAIVCRQRTKIGGARED